MKSASAWVWALWILFGCLRPAIAGPLPPIKTVFLIVMENQRWDNIVGNPSAAYINEFLLTNSSYCAAYYNSPFVAHPSEPNYIWLESGTNFGIISNGDPLTNHLSSTNHLVTQMRNAGISWRSYQEDICGCNVPLSNTNLYVARHNPFIFFDDVTGTNDVNNAYAIAHIRPYSELAADLAHHTQARYNFITPNLCHDMHDSCSPVNDPVWQGDEWLAAEIPRLMNSEAFQDNGAIFITWDEPGISGYGPIGMIVLSPLARGNGYASSVTFSHSSMVRTVQEIFGLQPFLGDAVQASNLSDLFVPPGLSGTVLADGGIRLFWPAPQPGTNQVVQFSSNLKDWVSVVTNSAPNSNLIFRDFEPMPGEKRFYRVLQLR